MKRRVRGIWLWGLLLAAGLSSGGQTPAPKEPEYSLEVTGHVEKPLKLSLAELAKLTRKKVTLKDADGTAHKHEGVPLIEVLAKAGALVPDHPRGKALAAYVLVQAPDGYEVAFGLGEVEPSISGRTMILAHEMDGKPLSTSAGPVRLVIEGDKRQARCVRMVKTIRVVRLGS